MATLYELNAAMAEIMARAMAEAEENEGVISEATSAELDALELSLNDKIENCIRYYKNESATAEMLSSEIDALKKRQKSHENAAAWMKARLAMIVKPGEKKEFVVGTIGWRKSSSVEVAVPLEQLPEKYVRTTIEMSPMKTEIKKALESGEIISGCRIINSNNISIK